jgi:serine/threonine protein kinase/tetratricopeptide (TPR) repeat protein
MGVNSGDLPFDRIRELGAGAAGRVWLVETREPWAGLAAGTRLALKEHRGPDAAPGAQAALLREAQVAQQVAGEGLPKLVHLESSEAGPRLYFEFVPGPSLDEILAEQGPLPEPQVRRLGAQLARALATLHTAGWAHGDVKPANVRLDENGAAVLLDLGGAQREGESHPQTGTLPYLSPERIRGAPPSPAADMFALGIVLHKLVTGSHPFTPAAGKREDPSAWLDVLSASAEALASDEVPTLSPLIDAILLALLSHTSEERPSAAILGTLLDEGESSAWWKERLSAGSTRRQRRSQRDRLPFVGRTRELEQLRTVHSGVRSEARGILVWLSGEPGSGKTRLVSNFAAGERAGPNPPLYLYGRCSPFGAGRPGHPVRSLLRRWLHLPSPKAAGERERTLLEECVDPATAETLILVLDEQHSEKAPSAEPLALAKWLVQLARRRPLVVFLDDVTFAGEESLRVISLVAERFEGAPLTFICGLRLGADPTCPAALESLQARMDLKTRAPRIQLGALDEEQVGDWVKRVFHSSAPRQRLARILFERSEGSPGALREIHRAMQDSGQTREHLSGEGLELLVPPAEIPRSKGIQQLIAERFTALDANAQLWLQRLAVVGGTIEREFLLLAFPDSAAPEIDAILGKLTRDGWLTPAGARYRFARPALREAIYRTLGSRRRKNLHAEAALALERLAKQSPRGGLGIQRAFHLHAAGEHESLLELTPSLLRRAARAGRAGREYTLAVWALEALEQLATPAKHDPLRRELLEAACDAAHRLGRRRDLEHWLDQLTELDLDPGKYPGEVGRIYLLHGRHAMHTGRFGLARGLLRNAQEFLHQADDPRSRAEALVLLAETQFEVGELEASRHLAQQAGKLDEGGAIQARSTLCLARLALVQDKIEEALNLASHAIATVRPHARQPRERAVLVRGLLARARIYSVAGRHRRALASLALARRGVQHVSDHHLMAAVNDLHGTLLLRDNRPQEAEMALREARLACQESGNHPAELKASLHLAVLLLEQNSSEAGPLLEQVAQASTEIGQHRFQALSHALLARAHRQLDAVAPGGEADRHSARALECMQGGVELPDRIVIVATRALILGETGRGSEGERLLSGLNKHMQRVNAHIADPLLRRRQRRSSRELLGTASSADGPIYPRVRSRTRPST